MWKEGGSVIFCSQVTASPYTFNSSNLKQFPLVVAVREIQTFDLVPACRLRAVVLVAHVWIFWIKDSICENFQMEKAKGILLASPKSLLTYRPKRWILSLQLQEFLIMSLCLLLATCNPLAILPPLLPFPPCPFTQPAGAHWKALPRGQWAGDVMGLTSCAVLGSGTSWEDLAVQFAFPCRTKPRLYWIVQVTRVTIWVFLFEITLPLVSNKFSQQGIPPLLPSLFAYCGW